MRKSQFPHPTYGFCTKQEFEEMTSGLISISRTNKIKKIKKLSAERQRVHTRKLREGKI